ncbi:hypothetical protein DEAC_c18260 [Desulfosporosinus acididurans]|uniref:Glycosyltransferase RgtA/B/C/D-like domain-containing protein n=1 Tax=Desulfosporosinus acididurans TaxID=476652 RepID=A0A0J1FSZ7_9FIRM|nr:hypothetical protein [Desulfosporosinus acididurans]KLU66427.1 hypothetical protein DEAC_c18260 [Desulfosporosinus acididurans]
MDAAIISQGISLIRWGLAFIMMYVMFPIIIFPAEGNGMLERIFFRYIQMVSLTLVIVYLLVSLKLYESLSFLMVIIIFTIFLRVPRDYRKNGFQEVRYVILSRVFDYLDGTFKPLVDRQMLSRKISEAKNELYRTLCSVNLFQYVLLLIILIASGYLRFYDTLQHAAPAMSDSYVTLAWSKYIDENMLFHDGIYPQGFYIYLSILHKFAAIDPLYVMKYTGPLNNGIITTIGIYLFVRGVTGDGLAGLVSAFVYGVLGGVLPAGWDRQGASLSQEFGSVFLFPTFMFALAYFQTRRKSYLWTVVAALIALGLIHTLILAYVWLGLLCMAFANLLCEFRKSLKLVAGLVIGGIASGFLAGLQVLIGWFEGKGFHSTSLEFLTQATQTKVPIPSLTYIDKLAIVGFVAFFLITLVKSRDTFNRVSSLFLLFLSGSSLVLYLIIGPMSGSELLSVRSSVMWALVEPIGVGLIVAAVLRILYSLGPKLIITIIMTITVICFFAWGVIYYKPSPAQPYKMQYDMEINEYLRISKEFAPAEWTLVGSEDEYDLALGRGWDIYIGDFLKWYNPESAKLVKTDGGKYEPLVAKDLFIFLQKKLFRVEGEAMKPILLQREKNYLALEKWIEKYSKVHNNCDIYYEDNYIVIYHIHDLKAD